MKPLTSAEIKGTWATVLLPVNRDETIDWIRLEDDLEFVLAGQPNGIYINGTAGEFLMQTEEEFAHLSQIVSEKCERHNVNFQIGASHVSPSIALARAARAAELKPSAIQVILPDWVAVNDAEAIIFLQKIAEIIAPRGIVLYNPPHAKRVLTPEEIAQLKKNIPPLIGVKVMDGDADWYARIRACCADLSVFVPGHRLASGYSQGASGAYSNVACLHPHAAQKWWELMQTDLPAALEIEAELQNFFRGWITPLKTEQNYSAAAIDKLLAAIGGWSNVGTRLRFPYQCFPETDVSDYRRKAFEWLPKFFALIAK